MKRSSGIIVGGLSATLLTAGAAFGTGLLSSENPDGTTTATATLPDATSDTSTGAAATEDSTTDSSTSTASPDASTDTSTDASTASPDATDTADAADTTDTASGTYTGEAISFRYGVFQAEITVTDGVMTDIAWLQEGEADHHSQRINEYAVPELESAILDAQSVDVGYVSGASFTSEAVEEAVYSAMQEAGLA